MRKAGTPEPGEIKKALWFTATFPEEIEADLQRYYSLDFVDLYRPGSRLGWRKLLVLLERLPPESAVMTAMRNSVTEDELRAREPHPELAAWSNLESLTALLIDEVRNFSWTFAQSRSESSVPRPDPVRRPGIGSSSRRSSRVLSLVDVRKLDPRLRAVPDDMVQATMNEMTGRRLWPI